MSGHSSCYVISVIMALFMMVSGSVVHIMDWWDAGVKYNAFDSREDARWRHYEDRKENLGFYYTNWIFIMWIIMYVTQLSWTLFGLELICRKRTAGRLYHNVPVVPSAVFIMTALSEAAILVWLYLWTSAAYFRYSPFCLLGSAASCYGSLALSVHHLNKNLHVLYGISAYRYVWEIRILVHNGLGLAASWITTVLFYSTVVTLSSLDVIPARQDGYVFLSLLGAFLVVWFVVDMSLARRYTPHLLTPYFVFLVANVGILLKSGLAFNYHFIYSVVLLLLTALFTLIRTSLAIGLATKK